MITMDNSHKKRLAVGSVASLGFASGQAYAVDVAQENDTLLFGLYGLPDWVPVLLVCILFAGFAWFAYAVIQRLRGTEYLKRTAAVFGIGGVLAGMLVASLSMDAWRTYRYNEIIQLAPTAAGRPSTGGPLALLDEADAEGAAIESTKPQKVLNGRARHARVNFDAINADTLLLNLFGDATVVAVRDRIVQNMQGGSVWVGHIADDPDSEVTLAVKGQALMGSVEWSGRSFEIVYVGGSTHAVRENDPNKIPAQYEPAEPQHDHQAVDGDLASTGSDGTTSADVTSTGQVIDVLVVYTPKARSNAGGTSGIETKIMNAVTRANQAYLNSKVNMQLNLVKMAETAYIETGVMSTALSRVKSTTDGYMDEVHTLRNSVGADEVVLITADSDSCGIAYRLTSLSTTFATSAFAAVHDDSIYNCLGSNNTFAHELGHTQGNVHDPDNSTGSTVFPDSYGYRVCSKYRDIMSYSCSGETRIPYFSNPDVFYNSQPTGILDYNNTARSMNATASTVASFRISTTVTTVPNTPTELTATATSGSAVAITWRDNASNETGYYVQRSLDGSSWSLIATLAGNATAFTDSGLNAGIMYYYQVYAYNSVGNSGFSNTASAQTQAAVTQAQPADTIAPVVAISNPLNGAKLSATVQTINVSASDNVAVTNVKLSIDGKLLATGTSGTLSYNWNTKKEKTGNHTIAVTAADAAGNAANTSITVSK